MKFLLSHWLVKSTLAIDCGERSSGGSMQYGDQSILSIPVNRSLSILIMAIRVVIKIRC